VKLKVYKHGLREGALLKFWPNSLKMREEVYHADTLVSGHCYMQSGVEVPYFPVEKMAEFPGGMNALYAYLVDNIKYPEKARRKGIEGRVRIKFVIQVDGSVADLKVQKSVEPLLDAEALRVVANMPHWIPGQQEGKNVKVQFVLPITFSLQ
jgi:protein TonB